MNQNNELTESDRANMIKSAQFSADRAHRYALSRQWNSEKPVATFVGLNPSTADETEDDPTIRRCIGFAKSWDYGGIQMVNLFSIRATDPKAMLADCDPIGPLADYWIAEAFRRSDLIVACWGANGGHLNRDKDVACIFTGYRLTIRPANMYCFGLTKGGHPKHPLYLSKAATLEIYC